MTRYANVATLALVLVTANAFAQGLPTSQPNVIQIIREEVKVGHGADHVKTEAGWPAAFEKAKSPHYYIALVSLTGANEAWYVVPYDSYKAMGDELKLSTDDAALAAELARLSKADAEHVTAVRSIQAVARKELSRGAFPDATKQRFYEVTIFRVRPGHGESFAAAAKAFGTAASRSAPNISYRVYEVVAGMPGPTYLVFSSVTGFADFDKMMSDDEATMKGATAEERAALKKLNEGLVNTESHRFRLDPEMSYVPKEVRAQDPAFWMPKKPAAKPPSQP
jgi:hypothetical protein